MEPDGDPEARIRDLERPLSDVARNSELGMAYPQTAQWDSQFPAMSPMPTTGPSRAYVIPVVVAVLAFVIAGGVSVYLFTQSVPSGPGNRPEISGGGSTLSDSPSTGGGKAVLPTTGAAAPGEPPTGSELAPAGATVTISGMGQHKRIDCDQTILSISGMENTVTVTGQCASVSVSGMNNVVTVDSTDSIGVSGFDNRIVFHTGDPRVSNSGRGNTVDRG